LETKKTKNTRGNTEQKEQCWRHKIPDFKLYYRLTEVKQHAAGKKNKHEVQWNRVEDPDKNLYSYNLLIFDKGTQDIQLKNSSLTIISGKTGYVHAEK
jgi:hypothetical protein